VTAQSEQARGSCSRDEVLGIHFDAGVCLRKGGASLKTVVDYARSRSVVWAGDCASDVTCEGGVHWSFRTVVGATRIRQAGPLAGRAEADITLPIEVGGFPELQVKTSRIALKRVKPTIGRVSILREKR